LGDAVRSMPCLRDTGWTAVEGRRRQGAAPDFGNCVPRRDESLPPNRALPASVTAREKRQVLANGSRPVFLGGGLRVLTFKKSGATTGRIPT
jgi:hypothetical protein